MTPFFSKHSCILLSTSIPLSVQSTGARQIGAMVDFRLMRCRRMSSQDMLAYWRPNSQVWALFYSHCWQQEHSICETPPALRFTGCYNGSALTDGTRRLVAPNKKSATPNKFELLSGFWPFNRLSFTVEIKNRISAKLPYTWAGYHRANTCALATVPVFVGINEKNGWKTDAKRIEWSQNLCQKSGPWSVQAPASLASFHPTATIHRCQIHR